MRGRPSGWGACYPPIHGTIPTVRRDPDLGVVPFGDYHGGHPERAEIVIEVAESSLTRDRGVKLRIYADPCHGRREVIIS